MRYATSASVVLTGVLYAAAAAAGQHGHPPAPIVHAPHQATVVHVSTPHTGGATHTSATHTRTTTHHTTKTTHTSTTTRTRTSTTTASTSPIAAKIESHPKLASKLTAMLPGSMTLDEAAAGFRNQGQFIAALHVSQNLGIPFADLRTEMVENHLSLGQSIQKLRPTTDSATAAKQGETEADHDLETSTTSSTTTTTTKHGKGR